MPFREYAPYFGPQDLKILAAAYQEAGEQLGAFNTTLGAERAAVLKKNIAQVILASACSGACEVERLKRVALKALA